jgi:hypothetical protein
LIQGPSVQQACSDRHLDEGSARNSFGGDWSYDCAMRTRLYSISLLGVEELVLLLIRAIEETKSHREWYVN